MHVTGVVDRLSEPGRSGHRQRRPAFPPGDRGQRVRYPCGGRHRRRHQAVAGRSARRRRRRRWNRAGRVPVTADETAVPLAAALDADRFGAKAANLARALRAGLPVPDGMALAPNAVRAVVDGGGLTDLTTHFSRWRALLAVRSSAIGEDGPTASFAGQHVTRLGVRATEGALRAAITTVAASATSPHAVA